MFEEKYTVVYLWIIMSSPWPCRHTSGFELAPVAGGKKDVSQVDQVWPVGKFGLFQRSLTWRAGICLRNLPRYRSNQQFHGKSVGPRAKRCQMDSPLGCLASLAHFSGSPMKDTKRIPKFQVCVRVCFYGKAMEFLSLSRGVGRWRMTLILRRMSSVGQWRGNVLHDTGSKKSSRAFSTSNNFQQEATVASIWVGTLTSLQAFWHVPQTNPISMTGRVFQFKKCYAMRSGDADFLFRHLRQVQFHDFPSKSLWTSIFSIQTHEAASKKAFSIIVTLTESCHRSTDSSRQHPWKVEAKSSASNLLQYSHDSLMYFYVLYF